MAPPIMGMVVLLDRPEDDAVTEEVVNQKFGEIRLAGTEADVATVDKMTCFDQVLVTKLLVLDPRHD
jgi:hypothetical protein